MENIFMGYNNVVFGENNNIISLFYLYDPRNYFKCEMKLSEIK